MTQPATLRQSIQFPPCVPRKSLRDEGRKRGSWITLAILVLTLLSVGCNPGGDSSGGAGGGGAGAAGGGGGGVVPATTAGIANGGGALESPDMERRPFSPSSDCKACHPRQFNEWRTSPHAYSGISPTFYSLVAAGQNGNGVGFGVNLPQFDGASQGGAVGNFCLPCHSPIAFIGSNGRYGGNNAGFGNVQPDAAIPFVCTSDSPMNAFEPCTQETSAAICGRPGACNTFQGRTCSDAPSVTRGTNFPRKMIRCADDSDCAAGSANGCPAGQDCGSCIIVPATIHYPTRAQEGINCEVCHTALPAHQRSCQLFRGSDATGVLSIEVAERGANEDGRRIRLGPYPVAPGAALDEGIPADQLPLIRNAFHESARVDSPLAVPYEETDFAFGIPNTLNIDPNIVRPTALTCEDLPYCGNAGAPRSERVCNGGPGLIIGTSCNSDFDCGGCGSLFTCGPGSPRAGLACTTSIDCNSPAVQTMNLLEIATNLATGDGTLGPLSARPHATLGVPGNRLDRSDANYFRSSMMCAACHDVRPAFANAILRSCQLQDSHVCSTNADCQFLNVGCPGNDCGPCVMENSAPRSLTDGSTPAPLNPGDTPIIDSRNYGYRRVENLFSEWQISFYNHPELKFCQENTFRACDVDADCVAFGEDEGPCDVESPLAATETVVTCQDCHMSNFPETPLVSYTAVPPTDPFDNNGDTAAVSPVVLASRNDLYSVGRAAIEGSQSDPSEPLPIRRVSTHFMSGVDVPLVKYPGREIQVARRQQLIDAGFKIVIEPVKNLNPLKLRTDPIAVGDIVRVDIEITNVGAGHRYPAGFSHERQNWVQMYVTEKEALELEGGALLDPFDLDAPCNLQRTVARSAEDSRDPVGAARLLVAGCAFRSGFLLDKAHPETGELVPDGSLRDEDPEDFFVVTGTRVRGFPGDPRIEVTPGAPGRALEITDICEEVTALTYRASIAAGSGIDMRENSDFPFQAKLCDPDLSPPIPGEAFNGGALGSGFTAPGFGNPGCMEGGQDLGPCVPEIELSDGNERGRCAKDLTRPLCQSDSECGDAGPCLFRCTQFPELQCCDSSTTECANFYAEIGSQECFFETINGEGTCVAGTNSGQNCSDDVDCPGVGGTCGDIAICIRGPRSGLGCDDAADCNNGDINGPASCGDVGPCNVENAGIVNFQNQFRTTENGFCVDLNNPVDVTSGLPIPAVVTPGDEPTACFLDLTCTLNGFPNATTGCLIVGQCAEDEDSGPSMAGDFCTNFTYADDCGTNAGGDTIACNIEFNLEINGRPSESVAIQTHPHNFNSLAPLQPRVFEYEFEMPPEFADKEFVIAARIMNRHFPMRFLRNLIGTQVVDPPLIVEAQGDPTNPDDCDNPRQIDIDCFVDPVTTLGNAEPGGFVPDEQFTRTRTFDVVSP